uniref:Uncharacterized protein n=1 Tax=Helianthus annuus TaxID=4232 RepID=A0A251SRZ7_HELAN
MSLNLLKLSIFDEFFLNLHKIRLFYGIDRLLLCLLLFDCKLLRYLLWSCLTSSIFIRLKVRCLPPPQTFFPSFATASRAQKNMTPTKATGETSSTLDPHLADDDN